MKEKIRNKNIKLFREEVKSYYGIEYVLILCGKNEPENAKEADLGSINKKQWWTLEYTENSSRLAIYAGSSFLWYDTANMVDARMQDKYHTCELVAMQSIKSLMKDYPHKKAQFIWREIWHYLWVIQRTTPQRIKYFYQIIFKK